VEPPPVFPPGEERRLVTVLFADVCGSTQLGERSDPEDLRALLGAFFSLAREVVEEHGGRLEKFIGDAVMAIFGLPLAHEDDPARGVGAGLDLRDRVREDPTLGHRLPIRIGVHSGEVVATLDASAADFLVTGDAVNTAARLQQAAEPWEVLVSERTVRAAHSRFVWEATGVVEARGKEGGVPARRAVARADAPHMVRPPLVDRADDLQLLTLAAGRAFGEPRPYLVTILAPAGTGKTRLAEEFLAGPLRRLSGEARIIVVRCQPCGEVPSCSPVRSLLLGLLDLPDGTDPARVRLSLREWLREAHEDGADQLAELLLGSVGEGNVGSANLSAILGAWRVAIELAASRRPLVLVADDLHAATDTFIALLEHVIAPAAAVPLLGIVLARTELLDRRPEWGAGHRNVMTLALGPLPDPDMASLVAGQLDDPSPALVQQVVERSAGNPFFAVELARALREPAGPAPSPTVRGRGPVLPDTVQGTLLARIDLLPAAARRLLQVGAVLGARFSVAAACAIDPMLEADVPAALSALERHDLVSSAPGSVVVFRHALVQDTAYETLTRKDRVALHAAAARWIDAEGRAKGDGLAEVIAYHWYRAATLARPGSVLGPDGIAGEAVRWLRRAAAVDLRRWASPEAAGHLRQALEIAPPEEQPALHEGIGDAIQRADEAISAYETALRLLRAARGQADAELRLVGKLILVHARTQGAVARRITDAEMAELVERGATLARQSVGRESIARYLIACGFLPYWRAGGDGAMPREEAEVRRRDTERGLRLAHDIGHVDLESCALDALAGIAQSLGLHREARHHARRRLSLGGELDLAERLDAGAFVAWESCLLGDYGDALEVTARELSLVELPLRLISVVHLLSWRAHAAAMVGDAEAALSAARGARNAWDETGRGPAAYAVHGFLAALEISRERGDDPAVADWGRTVEAVCAPLAPSSFAHAAAHIARLDRESLMADVDHPVALGERSHLVERALNACLDHGWLPRRRSLEHLLSEARRQGLRPLAAQAHRGLGLHGARSQLRLAHRMAAAMGRGPLAGSIERELAALTPSTHKQPVRTAGGGGSR
jgi:class 3 adenylate cyclase/tetratricopeptide (TPR) repeat protein